MEILRTIIVTFIFSILLISCNPFTSSSPDTTDGDADVDMLDPDQDTDITPEGEEEDTADIDTIPDGDDDTDGDLEESTDAEDELEETDIEFPPTHLLDWDGRMVMDCSSNFMLYVYRLKSATAGLTSAMAAYNGRIGDDYLQSDEPDAPTMEYQHQIWSAQIERENDYSDAVITPFSTDSAGQGIDAQREVIFRRDRRTRGGGTAIHKLTGIRLPYLSNEEVLAFAPSPPMPEWDTSDGGIFIISREDNEYTRLNIRRCDISITASGSVTTTNPTCEDPETVGLINLDMEKDYVPGMLRPVGYRNFLLLNVINTVIILDYEGNQASRLVAAPEPDMGSPDLWVESMAVSRWDEGETVDEGEFLGLSMIIPEGIDKGRYICVYDLTATEYSISASRRSCVKQPYTEAPWFLKWHWTSFDKAYMIASSADIEDKNMIITRIGNDATSDSYRKVERFSFGKPCTDANDNIVLSQPRTDDQLISGTTSSESLTGLHSSGDSIIRFYP